MRHMELRNVLGRDGKMKNSDRTDYDVVLKAVDFLRDSQRDQPALEDLAAHLGYSTAHCQKLFKRWCGLSPKEFLQFLTLDHAKALLDGSASVLDTAHEVGLSGGGRLHDLFVTHEAMTPGEYKRRGAGLEIFYGSVPCPFGYAQIMATERGICGLGFSDDLAGAKASLDDLMSRWPAARFVEKPRLIAGLAARIFDPSRWNPSDPIRLVFIGTAFDIGVWEELLHIGMGQAATYSDIARSIGRPRAQRAVGSAVGRNPISFIVPCHRVLRRDGGLGGYHWGVTRKRAIIGWEAGQLTKAGQQG